MGEMAIEEYDIKDGIPNEETIVVGEVIMIIGQIQDQTIGIEGKRTRQEIIMRTEEVGTMIGRRIAAGEIHQTHQEETVANAD